ncbi:hypothetical protein [Streptomyces venezuelae]|uniref:hypothetical protein n=1 Tax=Streptomyces venezuelae TaxID=54571 RepID=UPI00379DE664
MRTARGLCEAAAGLGVAAALVVLTAPRAAAGGPTSVLLVSPESTAAAALYYTDAEYAELDRWLEPSASGKQRDEEPPGLGVGQDNRQINVTWMVHDVRAWRVDRVYAPEPGKEKSGDVWVHRATDIESSNGDWHRAKEPERLVSLFKELGLLGKASDKGAAGTAPHSRVSPDAAGGGGPGDSGTDWWWAIPGAGAGAVTALLLRGRVTGRWAAVSAWRRRPHEPGPRQELRDL